MYLIIRLSPYLVGVASLVCFHLVIKSLGHYWWAGLILVALLVLAIWLVIRNKLKPAEKANFFFIPLLLCLSSLFFILFIEGVVWQYIFGIFISYILGLYLEKILIYLWQPEKHKPKALANLSIFFNTLIVFFTPTSLFGLSVYINFPIGWLVAALFGLLVIITGFNFWSHKIELKKSWQWRIVLIVGFLQIFFLIDIWPVSFYVKGILFSSLYYFINLIAVKQTSASLKVSLVWHQSLIVAGIWAIMLLTARW